MNFFSTFSKDDLNYIDFLFFSLSLVQKIVLYWFIALPKLIFFISTASRICLVKKLLAFFSWKLAREEQTRWFRDEETCRMGLFSWLDENFSGARTDILRACRLFKTHRLLSSLAFSRVFTFYETNLRGKKRVFFPLLITFGPPCVEWAEYAEHLREICMGSKRMRNWWK